jgi:hypothetical protein
MVVDARNEAFVETYIRAVTSTRCAQVLLLPASNPTFAIR